MSNESTKWLYGQLRKRGYNVGANQQEFDNLMATNAESRKWAYNTAKASGLNVGSDLNEFTSLVAPTHPPKNISATPAASGRMAAQSAPSGQTVQTGQKPQYGSFQEFVAAMQPQARNTDPMASVDKALYGKENYIAPSTPFESIDQRRSRKETMRKMAYPTAAEKREAEAERLKVRSKNKEGQQLGWLEMKEHNNGKLSQEEQDIANALRTVEVADMQKDFEKKSAEEAQKIKNQQRYQKKSLARAGLEQPGDPVEDGIDAATGNKRYILPDGTVTTNEGTVALARNSALQTRIAEGAKDEIEAIEERMEEIAEQLKELHSERDKRRSPKIRFPRPANALDVPGSQMGTYEEYPEDKRIEELQAEYLNLNRVKELQSRDLENSGFWKNFGYGALDAVMDPGGVISMSAGATTARSDNSRLLESGAMRAEEESKLGFAYGTGNLIGSVVADPVFGISGFGGKVGSNIIKAAARKGVAMKLASKGANAVTKKAMKGAIGRGLSKAPAIAEAVGGGMANIATFEGLNNAREQLRTNGCVNVGEVSMNAGRGAILGATMSIFGLGVGNIANKTIKSVEGTGARLAIKGGQVSVSVVGEGTIFAAPHLIENALLDDSDPRKRDWMDIWGENVLTVAALKGSHLPKKILSAPKRIASVRQQAIKEGKNFLDVVADNISRDRSMSSFNKDELGELKVAGYGKLKDLFEYKEAESNVQSENPIDGFETMEKLINDNRVSQATRAKAYYMVTGRTLPMGTIVGHSVEKTGNGTWWVRSHDMNGGVVTARRFKSERDAQNEIARINYQSDLNGVAVGEAYKESAASEKELDLAIKDVCKENSYLPEPLKKLWERSEKGEKLSEGERGIARKIKESLETYEGIYNPERPNEIRKRIEGKHEVDIEKALSKYDAARNDKERAALSEYFEELFPEELRKEATAEVEADVAQAEADHESLPMRKPVGRAVMRYDGREVEVLSGRVVMTDDGTMVDKARSEKTVVIRDPATGKTEMVAPETIGSYEEIGDKADMADGADMAEADPSAAASAQSEKGMAGALPFGMHDSFRVGVSGREESQQAIVIDREGESVILWSPSPIVESSKKSSTMPGYVSELNRGDLELLVKRDAEGNPVDYVPGERDEADGADEADIAAAPETTAEVPTETASRFGEGDRRTGEMATGAVEGDEQGEGPALLPQEEAAPVEAEATEGSVLDRIPVDGNGKHDFGAVDADTAWDGLVEKYEGNTARAQGFSANMVKIKEAALKKAQKAKSKPTEDPDEWDAAEQAREEAVESARRELEHWRSVADVERLRQEAIRAEQEAEARHKAAERAEAEKAERELREAVTKGKKELQAVFDEVKDCPEALETLSHMEPRDLHEAAAVVLMHNKLLMNDDGVRRGVMSHTGYGRGEMRKMIGMFARRENGGESIERLSEDALQSVCEEYGIPYDNQRGFNAMLEVLASIETRGDLSRFIQNRRIAQARDQYEGWLRAQEEARESWAYDNFGMSYDDYEAYEEQARENAETSLKELDVDRYNEAVAEDMERMERAMRDEAEVRDAQAREALEAIARFGNNDYLSDQNTTTENENRLRRNQTDDAAAESGGGSDGSKILHGEEFIPARGETENGGRQGVSPADGAESADPHAAISADARRGVEASGKSESRGESEEVRSSIEPTDYGDFGPIFTQFKGNYKGAIDKLTELKSGEAIGALHHKEIGDIDLVWGIEGTGHSDGMGLAKLVKYHPEVLEHLQEILDDMKVVKRTDNRVNLESETHKAAVRLTWNNKSKKWLLTAFEKKETPKSIDKTTDTGDNPSDLRGDTALSQNSGVSGNKGNALSWNKQASGGESLPQPSDNKEAQTIQSDVEAASAEVNTEPTPAQAEAGNYKKGHVRIGDFDITIENPAGSVRKGVDAKTNKAWETTMANAYGYIRGTESVDGDHIDVFLHTDMDQWNRRKVFVVDQTNRDGSFDEHKVMLGFNDKEEAMTAYLANYDKTWADTHPGLRISETNIENFNKWVQSSHRKTKPFADYSTVSKVVDEAPLSMADMGKGKVEGRGDSYEVAGISDIAEGRANKANRPNKPHRQENQEMQKKHRWISDEDADEFDSLRKDLRNHFGIDNDMVHEADAEYGKPKPRQMDAEVLRMGTRMTYLMMKGGLRSFSDYCEAMKEELPDIFNDMRPHLKSLYAAAQNMEEVMQLGWDEEMDDRKTVKAFDVYNFDKSGAKDIIETAKHVVDEQASLRKANEIVEGMKERRNEARRQAEGTSPLSPLPGEDYVQMSERVAANQKRKKEAPAESDEGLGGLFGNELENFDNQGNPIDKDGKYIVETVKTVDELTDEDFMNPTRNVALPSLPEKVSDAIGAEGRKPMIKKNIFGKNRDSHKDLTPEEGRKILNEVLYNPDLYGQNQKVNRPYNWIMVHLADKNSSVVLEVNPTKDYLEIVNWHYLNGRQLEQKKRQAEREGGRILTLQESNAAGDTSQGLSSEGKGNTKSLNNKGNVEFTEEENEETAGEPEWEYVQEVSERGGRYGRRRAATGMRSLFDDPVQGELSGSERPDLLETATHESAERANRAMDSYAQDLADYMEQSRDVPEEMLEETTEALLEKRNEAMAVVAGHYRALGNTEEDAVCMARDHMAQLQAEVSSRLNLRAPEAPAAEGDKPYPYTGDNGGSSHGYRAASGEVIAYDSAGGLPQMEEGEFALVERRFVEDGRFDFTASEKLESADDVAYLFRQLEGYATEHAFAVIVKGGRASVLHMAQGGFNATMVNGGAVRAAFDALGGAETVYFVHNHPSGTLDASRQDLAVLNNIRESLPEGVVRPGIIIDTTSGRYSQFDAQGNGTKSVRPLTASGPEKGYTVSNFDAQVFSPGYDIDSLTKVRDAGEAARFVSTLRLGAREKISFIVLDNQNRIVANFHTDFTAATPLSEVGSVMAARALRFGGTRVIAYGNTELDMYGLASEVRKQSAESIQLLDVVRVNNGIRNVADSASEPEVRYRDVEEAGAKRARIEKLRASEPVEVKDSMIPQGLDLTDRKEVQKNLLENVRGEYVNSDTGEKLKVLRQGIEEVTHHGMTDPAHVKSLFAIPDMLRNAIFIDEQTNAKGKRAFDSYRYYVCGLKIDGEDYTAKIVVGVKDGQRYYDHRLTQIEKGVAIEKAESFRMTAASNNTPSDGYKGTTLESLLQVEDGFRPREGAAEPLTETASRSGGTVKGKAYATSIEAKGAHAAELAQRLNTPIRVVRDVAELTNSDSKIQIQMRRSKGFYDPATGKVVVVLPNNADVEDIAETVFHEVVAHKGLRELIGEENYDAFCDEVYTHLKDDLKDQVDRETTRRFVDDPAKGYEHHRRVAVDEMFGRMAEKGFEDFTKAERGIWTKLKAKVLEAINRFLGTLKLPKWVRLGDNELRYMLWRSHERLRGKGDFVDMAKDAAKRDDLGLNKRDVIVTRSKRTTADKNEKAAVNEARLNDLHPDDSDHTAKVEKILETAKSALSQIAKAYVNISDPKGFISSLKNGLGLVGGVSSSGYRSFELRDGRIFTLRVSNHNINSENVKSHPVVSIVIKSRARRNTFIPAEGGTVDEFVYMKEDIRNAPAGTLSKIAEGISELLDTGIYTDLTGLAKENHSFGSKGDIRFRDGETGDIWKDRSVGLQERITNAAIRLSNNQSGDLTLRNDAQKAVVSNLQSLLHEMRNRRGTAKSFVGADRKVEAGVIGAMNAQAMYDRATVKRVSDLASILMQNGYLCGMTSGEMQRLLSAVKNATAMHDIADSVQKIMDIMIGNQLRNAEGALRQLLSIRGSKVDARGVEVQGVLDVEGQRTMEVVKKAMSLNEDDINDRIAEALNRMSDPDQTIADQAALEYAGLNMAIDYVQNIANSKAEEKTLRDSLKTAKEDRDAGRMTDDAFKQFVEATEDAIRKNKVERAEAYFNLVGRLSDSLRESIENAKAFREAEKARVREIHHNANSDMEGRPTNEHHKDNWKDKFINNSFVQFLFAPLGTFDQILRVFGGKSANGEGYLWNRFMRGWVDCRNKELLGVKEKFARLDEKAAELFGKGKTWGNLIRMEAKMPKATVSFWDGDEMRDHKLTQGNLLYIYMVDKMTDGRMKLRRMGITEDDITRIENFLDPRFKALGDWLQDEFLVDTRNEYNETHKRMFGASMAAIENYFPLKILANARVDKEEDVNQQNRPDGITTKTGSIIKRRVNNLALDITGADALSVILDHITQMEHWNAYAEWNRDLNTLRTYKRFRNQVINMTTVYGGGRKLWENFNDLCLMAAGEYTPKIGKFSKEAVNLAKGVTAAKVSFRMYTALKQFLSAPAYAPEVSMRSIIKSIANPYGDFKWCMENMPIFRERWHSRISGDPRLLKSDMDWKMWRSRVMEISSRIGMTPNAFVDAVTVSIGARAMYETRLKQYLKEGYPTDAARKRAMQDATILFNQTQQSSESPFLSTMQVDKDWLSTMFTVFRNSSMSYIRQEFDAIRNLKRNLTPGQRAKSIEFMTKQILRDWDIDPDTATDAERNQAQDAARNRFRKQIKKDVFRVATFGFIIELAWNLGSYLPYMIFGNDDDEKDNMWDDALTHAFFGSVEGLTGGDVMSSFGNMAVTGNWNAYQLDKQMPITGDVDGIVRNFIGGKKAEAVNDILNLLVQMGVGVNPQSLTDIAIAITDACGDDPALSHEAAIFAMRVLQVPQSQIDKMYFDEVDLTGEEVSKLTPTQLAQRYAEYKVKRGTPLAPWSWDDEERLGKYEGLATKRMQERLEAQGDAKVIEAYADLEARYKAVSQKAKAAKALMKTDYLAAAQAHAALREDPDLRLYQMFGKLDNQLSGISKMWLTSKTPEEAALIASTISSYRAGMVKALQAEDAESYQMEMSELTALMNDFYAKYQGMQPKRLP